ncbi:MAG TPA: sulfurtransferase TusA family protein [Candidatus Aquicultor sp.]|jgi:TusA-related sulfurtransferase
MADKVVDARGSYCPGPLMELIKTIRKADMGTTIEVLSSDSGSARDIPEWAKKTGQELVYNEKAQDGEYWKIAVKKVK